MAILAQSLHFPDMYRIAWGDGTFSDYLNLSRAKDILRELREKEKSREEKAKRT